MISILFARFFKYLEHINQEDFMFMDYSEEEKQEMIDECEAYDKAINKKKSPRVFNTEE